MQFTACSLGVFCVREGTPNQSSEKYDNMRTRCANLLAIVHFNPYPTAFPYGNGIVLHLYQ